MILTARYLARASREKVKGAGGLACLAFTGVLGGAFWAGAVFASTPWAHWRFPTRRGRSIGSDAPAFRLRTVVGRRSCTGVSSRGEPAILAAG